MAHGEVLRIRPITAVVEDGLPQKEAGPNIFRVGIASAIRWVKAFEKTHGGFGDRRGRALCAEAASGLALGTSAQGE